MFLIEVEVVVIYDLFDLQGFLYFVSVYIYKQLFIVEYKLNKFRYPQLARQKWFETWNLMSAICPIVLTKRQIKFNLWTNFITLSIVI